MFSFMKDCMTAVMARSWGFNSLVRPVVLHLTLTDRCNLRCRMCNIWKKDEKRDTDLELVRAIARSRYGRSIRILDVTGGEPLLGDIHGVASAFAGNNLRLVLISTNGVLTRRAVETVGKLLQIKKLSVHLSISLDGTREYHDNVRGAEGVYDGLNRTIGALQEAFGNSKRLRLGVKMTVMPDNVDQIVPVYDHAVRNGLDFTAKPADVFAFLDNKDMAFQFDERAISAIKESFAYIISREKARRLTGTGLWGRVYHASNIIFHEEMIKFMERMAAGSKPRPPAPCLSSFLSVMVHSDGKAYSCPTLMREIGDIGKEGFDGVWTNRRMKATRSLIRSGKCSCFSQCDQMPSLMMSNKTRLAWLMLRSYMPSGWKEGRCLACES